LLAWTPNAGPSRMVILTLLVCLTLTVCVGCVSSRTVVLREGEKIDFIAPGETFTNPYEFPLVVMSKGDYVEMTELVDSILEGD